MADSKDIDITIAVAGMQKLGEAFRAFGDIVGQSLGATFEAVATLHRELKPSDDEHAARAAYQWYESDADIAPSTLDRVMACRHLFTPQPGGFVYADPCALCGATRREVDEINDARLALVEQMERQTQAAMLSPAGATPDAPKGDRYTRAIDLT